uniref:Uncharacterized protein n=1 Tax=Populus trichocarpa TaxID=3694 RepID=A0A3N7EDE0_POPTR
MEDVHVIFKELEIFHFLSDSKFTQQEHPAWKPIPTPRWVVFAFVLVAIVFIPIDIACLTGSQDVSLSVT